MNIGYGPGGQTAQVSHAGDLWASDREIMQKTVLKGKAKVTAKAFSLINLRRVCKKGNFFRLGSAPEQGPPSFFLGSAWPCKRIRACQFECAIFCLFRNSVEILRRASWREFRPSGLGVYRYEQRSPCTLVPGTVLSRHICHMFSRTAHFLRS
jgi:hypothetical protein